MKGGYDNLDSRSHYIVVEGGDGMEAAGLIIFVLGLCAAFGGYGGYLRVNHGRSALDGTPGFVMICLGAIMMFL